MLLIYEKEEKFIANKNHVINIQIKYAKEKANNC